MAQKYNNYNEVMRELYRTSYLESPKVFIATDYGYDDYAYMQQKLDELFWFTETFQLPIRILADATYDEDTLVIRYADEYELTKILYYSNQQKTLRLSELRLEEFFKLEEILSLATHFIVFTKECTSDFSCLIERAKEKKIPTWVFDKNKKE